MHDLLFENNKAMTDADIRRHAKSLGLKMSVFSADLVDPAIEKDVKEMQAQGSRLGARGTPAFFVNGRFLSGARPITAFKKLIDEELAKARVLVASGVARRDVYRQTIAKGASSPD